MVGEREQYLNDENDYDKFAVIYVPWSGSYHEAWCYKKKSSRPKKRAHFDPRRLERARWKWNVQSLSFYCVLDALSEYSIS